LKAAAALRSSATRVPRRRAGAVRGAPVVGSTGAATVGDALLDHLTHSNRHVGEIACLRGLQGLRAGETHWLEGA
jgi:hypothetical protein